MSRTGSGAGRVCHSTIGLPATSLSQRERTAAIRRTATARTHTPKSANQPTNTTHTDNTAHCQHWKLIALAALTGSECCTAVVGSLHSVRPHQAGRTHQHHRTAHVTHSTHTAQPHCAEGLALAGPCYARPLSVVTCHSVVAVLMARLFAHHLRSRSPAVLFAADCCHCYRSDCE